MSRAYTKEEVREMLLGALRQAASYWASPAREASIRERCEGVAFSLLNCIDGTSGSFPCALALVLSPHPDDKAFHVAEGENYIEPGMVINDDCHLHDLFFKPTQSAKGGA